jgi:RNA polymerase sigma-70 factor, ECF subfamily
MYSNETELAALAARGNRAAFEELVKNNYMLVYRVSYKYSGLKEDAEDITQEVFGKLGSVIYNFKGDSSFKTWLYRITANAAKDYLRKHKNRLKNDAYDESLDLPNSGDNQEEALYKKQVFKALANLPEKLREAMVLVYSEGLSHAEAAKICGCTESTVSWRVHEARKKLLNIKEKIKLIISWLF